MLIFENPVARWPYTTRCLKENEILSYQDTTVHKRREDQKETFTVREWAVRTQQYIKMRGPQRNILLKASRTVVIWRTDLRKSAYNSPIGYCFQNQYLTSDCVPAADSCRNCSNFRSRPEWPYRRRPRWRRWSPSPGARHCFCGRLQRCRKKTSSQNSWAPFEPRAW